MVRAFAVFLETVKTDKRLTRSSVFCRFFSLYLSFTYFLVVFTLFIVVFKSLIACLFIILQRISEILQRIFCISAVYGINSLENFSFLQLIRVQILSVCCQSCQSPKRLQSLCTSAFCQSVSLQLIFQLQSYKKFCKYASFSPLFATRKWIGQKK